MSDDHEAVAEGGGSARPMRIFLGSVLLVLVAHLLFGDQPWEEGVARREAEGNPIRPVDLWVTYGYWVAAANAVIVALALLALRHWFDRRTAPVREDLAAPPRPSRAVLWLSAAAVLAGVGIAVPRLDQSLWDDEVYNVKRSIAGGYFHGPDGELEYRKVKLRSSFWYYRKPNNHVPHTLLARLSVGVHRLLFQPELRFVNEVALRIPALLAGAGSIAAVAWLAWRLGFPWAGVLAAWLLALHPWHSRYLSEARGYSMVMLLVSLTIGLLVLALHRGTWRRWIGYGSAQMLLIWTYPATVDHLLVLNAVAVGFLVVRDRGQPSLRSQLTRWLFVSSVGALTFVQLMTPNAIQFVEYEKRIRSIGDVGLRWLQEFGSHLIVGAQFKIAPGDHPAALYPELLDLPVWLVAAFVALAAVGLASGVVRLLRAGGLRAALVATLLLPGLLTWLQALLREDHLYVWYLIFVLPALALLISIGFLGGAASGPRRALGGLAAAAFVGLLVVLGAPTHQAQWERPFYPRRDAVERTRPTLDPFAPENRRIVTVGWVSEPSYYDPNIRVVKRLSDLEWLAKQARRGRIDLFVNLGRLAMCRDRRPELTERVESGRDFEKIAVLPGFSGDRTYHVWRHRGKGFRPDRKARAGPR